MKVTVSTVGRFHLFALARELERHGALERIYSGFIWSALAREDVSRSKVTTFPWFRTPLMALGRLPLKAPRVLESWLDYMSCVAQDDYVARVLPECDVFIGHDGSGLNSGYSAKRRGLIYITDTGSSHVGAKLDLLEEEFAINGLPFTEGRGKTYERMLEEYEAADAIIVASSFARNSFLAKGFPQGKIRLIPYGARIEQGQVPATPPEDRFRIVFVGLLSIRKGARYLFEAFRKFSHPTKELVIVGQIADEVRPLIAAQHDLNVTFLGHVPNGDLATIYSSSHVLLFPSVEDGFGMVMAEAMACGCPVIASTNTGAVDLFTHGQEGFIVPIRDPRAIADYLTLLADDPSLRARMSAASLERVRHLGGWTAYGDAYVAFLSEMRASRSTASQAALGDQSWGRRENVGAAGTRFDS